MNFTSTLESSPTTAKPHGMQRLTGWLTWMYAAGVVTAWLLLKLFSDVWWPATVLMYGPRWVYGLPLVVLIPAALLWRRRLLGVQLACLLLVVGPIMGLNLPWRNLFASAPMRPTVRVLSLNTDRTRLDAPALARLLRDTDPDIVALQEWTSRNEKTVFESDGWEMRRDGEFYLATRFRILSAELMQEPPAAQHDFCRYVLETRQLKLHVINLHLQTPRGSLAAVRYDWKHGYEKLEANTAQRRQQSRAGSDWARQVDGPLLIAGDFNMTDESAVFHEFWSPYPDAWTQAGSGWGYTYRNRRTAIRIDHILSGPGWRCRRCWVGPDLGSEHLPVIADFEWTGELPS
ncbi:MAG: endonuclease/exonuclease/phosphatase family protein [Planctomycetia bacterium]|nr:endonuclease/exonuclease/phosphatase family protein [Planctomycetia bacterium]